MTLNAGKTDRAPAIFILSAQTAEGTNCKHKKSSDKRFANAKVSPLNRTFAKLSLNVPYFHSQ